ncbi:MAG: phospho-N-acetylmuramoyl-pentapeptide-transferase [Candidatus Saccharimonadales bacterium]|nr:phospho-N-acetylmuramoyl-pentapeptide-transferase [Candidatus Saccharimonadales bacterium]
MEYFFSLDELSDEIIRVLILSFLGFAIATLITPIYTTLAYNYKFWKRPREEALTGEKASVFSKLHKAKHQRQIPTMAGLITIASVVAVSLMFNWTREQTWLPVAALVGAGGVGFIDDLINIRGVGRGIAGLNSKIKLGLITAVATIGAWYFFSKLGYDSFHIPFPNTDLTVGWLLIPIFIFVVVSTANAVNITDGLDGLAGGLLVSAFGAFGIIAFMQTNYGIAAFCMTIVGALLSYVWFNIYPARFFMGDVGSFALGTALGVVAMLTDTLMLLPVIGLVFVLEAGSSLAQLISKKVFGRKLFVVAPVHHHFEAQGWPETKVTMRFWIIGQVMAVLGVLLALIGGHI